nr:mitofusin-2-like [Pocillopora verrucosa]
MTSSLSQFELAKSFQNGGINRMHEGFPLPSDVNAKKMSNIFSTFKTEILEFQVSVKETIVALGENEQEFENVSSEVEDYVTRVSRILEVLSRDQIKVAFIGQTSNGKSTTLNAILQSDLLPMGMGCTTNCFLSVHCSDSQEPDILVPDGDGKKNMPLDELTCTLYKGKLDPGSRVEVRWPKSSCNILSEDVVLVDSPGIDVSPYLDMWIDEYCLDADVFVLVANAESTLAFAEKNFFDKRNQHLSRPYIFILYNKWDVCASEPDKMELVKNQHLSRSTNFLVDELKCVDKELAKDRVFFVSAKETLMSRMQEHQGMPQGAVAIDDEGFLARQMQFKNFERKFEECISQSPIETKFKPLVDSGLEIANMLKDRMKQVEGSAFQKRSPLEKAKKEVENSLKYVKEQLELCKCEVKCLINEITSKVADQIAEATTEEISRLGSLVNKFIHPFPNYLSYLGTYKEHLCNHLESDLGRNMMASSSNFLMICQAHKQMADRFRRILSPKTPELSLELVTPALDFQANFKLTVTRLCNDFSGEVEFHCSLGWQAILRKFLKRRHAEKAIAVEGRIQRNVQSLVRTAPAVVRWLASLTTLTAILLIIVGGLIWKTVGWWLTALCGVLYGVVYVIERVYWDAGAGDKALKRQFVNYASKELLSQGSVVAAKCIEQVQQELTSTSAKFEYLVQKEKENLERKKAELHEKIASLEEIEDNAKMLRKRASWFETKLSKFISEFGAEKSRI